MARIRRGRRVKFAKPPTVRHASVYKSPGAIRYDLLLRKADAPPLPPYVGHLERMIKAAVEALKLSFDAEGYGTLARALTPGALIAALDWGGFGSALSGEGFTILNDAAKAGAVQAADAFGDALHPGLRTAFQLFLSKPDVVSAEWAQANVGRLIKDTSDEIVADIRGIVAKAELGHYDTKTAASLIRSSIGLSSRQAEWVSKNFDANFKTQVAAGLDRTAAARQAQDLARSFSDRLLDSRALTIARTEVATATMAGRKMGYDALDASGIVDTSQGTHSWLPDPQGCCPVCQGNVDAGTIAFTDSFPSGDDRPPAHPNCECDEQVNFPTTLVTIPDDLRASVGLSPLDDS